MIFDDNILKFMDCGKTLETDLPDLIRLGFSEMRRAKAKIWSGSDSPNPAHWSADVDIGMGLVCLTLLSTGRCLMGMQVLVLSGSLHFLFLMMDQLSSCCQKLFLATPIFSRSVLGLARF